MNFKIKFFICVLVFLGLERICNWCTDGFRLSDIRSTLSYQKRWETTEGLEAQKSKIIFRQPYYYLGKGAQVFAFVSQDQKYVIKFFRHNRMRPALWHQDLPLPHWLEKKRTESVKKRRDKLEKDFNSYKIAFDQLKEETALIYLHLNKTASLNQTLILYDKIGIRHQISLDDYEFIIQKKAAPFYPTLQRWISAGQEERAKQALCALVKLLSTRCQKGIFDKDPNIETNFGLIENHPVQFDIGRFKWDQTRKDQSQYPTEIRRIVDPLRIWLSALSPTLEHYLNNKIKELE